MGTRKRAGKGHDKKSEANGKPNNYRPSSGGGNLRGVALVAIALVALSGGIYVYYSDDAQSLIGSLLDRNQKASLTVPETTEHATEKRSSAESLAGNQNQQTVPTQTKEQSIDEQVRTGKKKEKTKEQSNDVQPQVAKKEDKAKEQSNDEQPQAAKEEEKAMEQSNDVQLQAAKKEDKAKEQSNDEQPQAAMKEEKAKEQSNGEQPQAAKKEEKKGYAKADLTNSEDNKIRADLDEAESWISQRRPKEAIRQLDRLLTKYPQSPRATYLKAEALCIQAELESSNPLLEKCIEQYLKVLDVADVPRALMLKSGRSCASRQQFRGWGHKAIYVLNRLIKMYPDESSLWNEIGVQNLMINRNAESKFAFEEMLKLSPADPYALAHLGFIEKVSNNNPDAAIPLLRTALQSDDPSVHDGRFFFHLGDALQRVGNRTEAHEWYQKGAGLGLFRSKWQRSLYNVDHLDSWPWWTHEQTRQQKLIKALEDNWAMIRDEGLANMDNSGGFRPEEENLREKGVWKQLTLFQQGRKKEDGCRRAPKTCALLEKFPEATGCKRGQIKFSVMQPGVHVWPHCGPTNCRVRVHLGLVVPENCCQIRVTDDIRTWQEGKVIVFDDSFEHEVWHDGDSFRMVLIVDIWHPDLTQREKMTLPPI